MQSNDNGLRSIDLCTRAEMIVHSGNKVRELAEVIACDGNNLGTDTELVAAQGHDVGSRAEIDRATEKDEGALAIHVCARRTGFNFFHLQPGTNAWGQGNQNNKEP